jgi:hypothetical protein
MYIDLNVFFAAFLLILVGAIAGFIFCLTLWTNTVKLPWTGVMMAIFAELTGKGMVKDDDDED